MNPRNHISFKARLTKDNEGWVALCPDLDIASQGDRIDGALANLKEAIELFFETASAVEIRNRLNEKVIISPFAASKIPGQNDSKPPRAFSDYGVTIDGSAIPDGVEVIERI